MFGSLYKLYSSLAVPSGTPASPFLCSNARYRGLNLGGLNYGNEDNPYSERSVSLIKSAKINEKRKICFPFRHAFSDSAYFFYWC